MKKSDKLSGKRLRNSAAKYGGSFFRILMLSAVGYLVIFPLVYIISNSIKTQEAFRNPLIVWITSSISFDSYKLAFEALDYKNSIVATIIYEIVSAVLEVGSCAVAAYGLSRFEFKGKKFFMAFLLLMIIVPEQMIVLPNTVTYSNFSFFGITTLINKIFGTEIRLNILDTVLPFWMPSIFGVGLKAGILIYIYMQFFKGLPKELEEAAWIDGAGPYRTFFCIAIPSSTVVIFTVFIFSIIWHWNDYSYAIMYVNENYTTAVKLSDIVTILQGMGYYNSDVASSIILAACLIFILPVLVLYIAVQKKFIKSIDRVGITG